METTMKIVFGSKESYNSYIKGFNLKPNNDLVMYLHETDCQNEAQKLVFEFIKNNFLEDKYGFYYYGYDVACKLCQLNEQWFEEKPYFFKVLIDKRKEIASFLSEIYEIEISTMIIGGRFGDTVIFHLDLDLVPFDELYNFLKQNKYYNDSICEDIYYYVTERPEYFENFASIIEWLAPGCGKYASEILKCNTNYIDIFEKDLLKVVSHKDRETIKKNIKDIYYYASHY